MPSRHAQILWRRQSANRLDHRQPGAHRPLGIVLMRLRIAEIDQDAVAHVLGDKAGEAADRVGDGAVVVADQLAQILGVMTGRQRRRADQIAEHHGQLPAFGFGGSWCVARCRRLRGGGHRRGFGCTLGQCGDSIQHATAVPDRRNPEFAQIVGG
jgi:hypothetical protein